MSDETMKPIDGEKMRQLRDGAGLSQAALAEKAGISRSYVSDIERGRVIEVSEAVLNALEGVFTDSLEGARSTPEPATRTRRVRGRPRRVPV